jgi:hypothetical protein
MKVFLSRSIFFIIEAFAELVMNRHINIIIIIIIIITYFLLSADVI